MPEPLVVQQAREFKAQLLAREYNQSYEMSRRWLDVERALSGNIGALAEEFARLAREGKAPTRSQLGQMGRYHDLLAQLQVELRSYTEYAESLIVERQRQYAQLGINHASALISASDMNSVGAYFNVLPVEATEFMVGMAGDGSPLRQLLVSSWPDAAQGLTDELIRSTVLGVNPRETARRMANGSTRSLNRMLTISRTEQLRVYRESSRMAYQESGVVNGYKRIATKDSRVCAACLMDDGAFYELNEVMPEHPNGRCSTIPAVDGLPEVKWQKGQDWLLEQSPEVQQSILGKGRFDAWQNGQFDLDELIRVKRNRTWGDSLQVKPLQELT